VKQLTLAAILLLYAAVSIAGIGWGLPSRDVDRGLFTRGEPWTGERIARLAGTHQKSSPTRGADVDVDPLDTTDRPILLTKTDEQAAAIYLRYRLYTHQPDEMITMMALAQMHPGNWDFDPRLYQYGGLFIYPVGGLIKFCGLVGLIEVRSDLTYYLDHPDEFGRFYIAARAYVVAWGLIGVLVMYLIARRLANYQAGLFGALLFVLLPVVICMSHEAKPHLPGAVLMLLAVLFAMHYADTGKRRHWLALCLACGAAFGMVLSSLPIFVLIPLVEIIRIGRKDTAWAHALRRTVVGVALAVAVYAVTNPYIPINLIANREVLRSNFGNSLAMYEIDRLGEGFLRMLALTVEGATWPILLVGIAATIWLVRSQRWSAAPLVVPAGLIFVQFVLIGAGKPAEYGRFGVFADAALVVATAFALTRKWRRRREWINGLAAAAVVVWVGLFGFHYLHNFLADSGPDNTRHRAAERLAALDGPIGLLAEPAPYCCPPLDFAHREVWLFPSVDDWTRRVQATPADDSPATPRILIATRDHPPVEGNGPTLDRWALLPDDDRPSKPSPISWANKPICARQSAPGP